MVRPSTLALVLALASCGLAGCASRTGDQRPVRALPSYAGHEQQLFDDTVEPAAVGLDYQKSYVARADMALRERAQISDAVVRVRVTTFTAKNEGPEAIYQLSLHVVEKVTGKYPPSDDFSISVDKSSESYGIMKSFESRLVGYSFVAFVRSYVRPDGDSVLHFHLSPDTKDVKLAISDALLLGEAVQ